MGELYERFNNLHGPTFKFFEIAKDGSDEEDNQSNTIGVGD